MRLPHPKGEILNKTQKSNVKNQNDNLECKYFNFLLCHFALLFLHFNGFVPTLARMLDEIGI
jgi:hypothetical protein